MAASAALARGKDDDMRGAGREEENYKGGV